VADRTLPYSVWQLVVRSPADEDAVQRFLSQRTDEARRGFVAALLVIARRATPEQLAAGWPRLPTRVLTPDPDAEMNEAEPPPTLVVAPAACLRCSTPLPPPRADGGRPRVYCSDACRAAADLARRMARRADRRVEA
jgi:hypothetical protein